MMTHQQILEQILFVPISIAVLIGVWLLDSPPQTTKAYYLYKVLIGGLSFIFAIIWFVGFFKGFNSIVEDASFYIGGFFLASLLLSAIYRNLLSGNAKWTVKSK